MALAVILFACLLTLGVVPVSLPEAGSSEPAIVNTRTGQLKLVFTMRQSLEVEISGLTAADRAAGMIELSPVVKPGTFRTIRLDGERWKCLPVDEAQDQKWLTEEHLDLATSRVPLSAAKSTTFVVPLTRFVAEATKQLEFRLSLPGTELQLVLELARPYALSPIATELLRQSSKLGPTLLTLTPRGFRLTRVQKTLCGDQKLTEELFDETMLQVLAYPTPDSRLLTAHGWVFAEKFESPLGVPPVMVQALEVKNATFLGMPYSRELVRVEVRPGKATAVFQLGDFSGAFGAGGGDPVNVREARVTLEGGRLSTTISRR